MFLVLKGIKDGYNDFMSSASDKITILGKLPRDKFKHEEITASVESYLNNVLNKFNLQIQEKEEILDASPSQIQGER